MPKSPAYVQTADQIRFEQYKLLVEMADRVSDRRLNTNKFFIALLTGLLTVTSLILSRPSDLMLQPSFLLIPGVLGLALCLVWILNIESYKKLNSAKFKVINELEEHLPASGYRKEWEILSSTKGHRRLTNVEKLVPCALSIPYSILVLLSQTI